MKNNQSCKAHDLLTLDVISVSQTTKFLLTSSIPDVEPDWTTICVKYQWMYLDAQCSYHMHNTTIVRALSNTIQTFAKLFSLP